MHFIYILFLVLAFPSSTTIFVSLSLSLSLSCTSQITHGADRQNHFLFHQFASSFPTYKFISLSLSLSLSLPFQSRSLFYTVAQTATLPFLPSSLTEATYCTWQSLPFTSFRHSHSTSSPYFTFLFTVFYYFV